MSNPRQSHLKNSLAILSMLLALPLIWGIGALPVQSASSLLQETITVSGTVSGPAGPVAGVWVGVGSPMAWRETHTDGSGCYSVDIWTDGTLWFHLRPDPSSRLAQVNHWTQGIAGDLEQDFELVEGNLLDLQVLGSDGAPIWEDLGLELLPLQGRLAEGWWYSLEMDEDLRRYQAFLPPDVYYLRVHHVPADYYETIRAFDLRSGGQVAEVPLNTSYVHPIPSDPPDASRIVVGPVDALGQASITGTAGAVLPLAQVLLVNLNSNHQAHTVSEADGSFRARLYAPPGSSVQVKHGPASPRWSGLDRGVSEGVNPFPGTILYVPHTHAAVVPARPFAAAGAVYTMVDDPIETHNYVGAAWALTGTLSPIVVEGRWARVLSGTYGGEPKPDLYLGGLHWTHPALADLDGDGDLDLLLGERSGQLLLYRNAGSAAVPAWLFEMAGYAGVSLGGWVYPALADVTADGAPDLFVGCGNGRLLVYYNQGPPEAPSWPAAPDETLFAGEMASPALADLDTDGDVDLLVGYGGGRLFLFENTGTAGAPIWEPSGDGYGGIMEDGGAQPAFLDLDGDGDMDLLLGRCGSLAWYRNDGPPTNPTWTQVAEGTIRFEGSCGVSLGVGDWDGDGDSDLVTGEHWGGLRFYRNDGTAAWIEQPHEFPFELAGDTAPALADWDGDGDLDLLLGQVHGMVLQYTNQGSAAAPDWRPDGELLALPWTDHPHAFPTFADVDGDGDEDLFVGEGGWSGPGAGGNIHYYQNQGTPQAPDWVLSTTAFLDLDVGGWSRPTFADIDADGDLDLFVGDEAGTLTFVENTGTVTAPAWAAPVRPYVDLSLGAHSAPAFLDLDGDGDLDLLVGLEHGSLAYVRNTGTASNPAWELLSTLHPDIDVGELATPAAADLDGDGRPELLIGDGDGGLNLYRYGGPAGRIDLADYRYAPGDLLQMQGRMILYGPAITATTDLGGIHVFGGLNLQLLFDEQGRPLPAENNYLSTMLTPGGQPIQRPGRAGVDSEMRLELENLRYLAGHAIAGDLHVQGQLPTDILAGTYRPLIWFDFAGVPTSTDWLAANVTHFTYGPNEAALPPIRVGQGDADNRLHWQLLMDDVVQGTRGTMARQDRGSLALASQVVSQGAAYYRSPRDTRSGQPLAYRLEPFLPMFSFTDRRLPAPPLLPLNLPGGRLQVALREPDGTVRDLGSAPLAQSFNRTRTTRLGHDLNAGTTQLNDVYSLMAASEQFRVGLEQYGHYLVTMTGVVSDVWGNAYTGGGTYDLWVAEPLDIDPGVLPGTPLAVGDAFNPVLQFYPRVPAAVTLTLTLYPSSNPDLAITYTLSGRANPYGYFDGPDRAVASPALPIILSQHGEYRVDLVARYRDEGGTLYMGAMTWGGVVMTPPDRAQLVAHGRRGVDSLSYVPNHWFVVDRDLDIPEGTVFHSYNPYYNGDLFWSCMGERCVGGDALLIGASVQDTVGKIESAIRERAGRVPPEFAPPGTLEERFAVGELPLFISTLSGRLPQLLLRGVGGALPRDVDQVAYSYRSSQRPGVRVREVVSEDGQNGGYWRLDTLYDDQLGVGVLGDQPNDFKFQYVGTVYRDLETGHSEYGGQGTGWIFLPDDDDLGGRVMPPFAGAGNGGWTTEGGPILTLKGEDVHLFILPTGTPPGAVLQVGDHFRFAGHVMPTLNSRVALTVTSPGGRQHLGGGQANSIGYYYDPADDVLVNEVGLWSVDVRLWHEGQCSGGSTVPPYPSGDVLGSEGGRYWFYAVPPYAQRLEVTAPSAGFLSFDGEVTPIWITGTVPAGLYGVVLDYTIRMPGYILQHGQVRPTAGVYKIAFDPAALHEDFPNLDLVGRGEPGRAGLADAFSIDLLLRGWRGGGPVYRANTVTLQGEQVFVGSAGFVSEPQSGRPLRFRGRRIE